MCLCEETALNTASQMGQAVDVMATRRSRRISMSVGGGSGRPPNHAPSGMEAMPWSRTRRDCRARPFARGAGSWNRAAPRSGAFAVGGGTARDRAVPTRHQAGAGDTRRPGDPWRPALGVALDLQESGEAHCGADERGLQGELDDGGTLVARAGLSAAVGAQESRRGLAPGPQCTVRTCQCEGG